MGWLVWLSVESDRDDGNKSWISCFVFLFFLVTSCCAYCTSIVVRYLLLKQSNDSYSSFGRF